MNYLSLFTGVGGLDLGFDAAGLTPVAQVEIDRDCRNVLAHHWPDTPRYVDVADYHGSYHPADIVTGGFPCQDVSLAGKRRGMEDGTRSNLYTHLIRIVKEMRDANPIRWLAPS